MTHAPGYQGFYRILCWSLCLLPASAWSGNRGMVEKRVEELAELNQKLINQEAEIPKDGHLELKAHVHYGTDGTMDLRVYSRKFSAISEEPIKFEGKRTQLLSN